MWERIRHNWGYKMFAFLTAAILWMYVRTQQNPLVTQEIKKEIEVKGLAPGLLVTSPLPPINLIIKAPKKRLEQIDPQSIKVEISLAGKGEGSYDVPLIVSAPKGVKVSYKVRNVNVILDRMVSQQVPVQAVPTSLPPEGFSLSGLYLNPTDVIIYYPLSQKETLLGAQVLVDLSRGEGEVVLPVLVVDKENKPVANVRVTPPFVKATISLKTTKLTKVLPIVPNLVGSLPNNLVLEKVEVSPPIVSVTGPSSVLGELSSIKTEKIDLSRIESSCSLEVPLEKLERVSFLDTNKAIVRIIVSVGGQ